MSALVEVILGILKLFLPLLAQPKEVEVRDVETPFGDRDTERIARDFGLL